MNNEHVEPIWFCSIVSDPIYIESAKTTFFKDKRHQEAFKIKSLAFLGMYTKTGSTTV